MSNTRFQKSHKIRIRNVKGIKTESLLKTNFFFPLVTSMLCRPDGALTIATMVKVEQLTDFYPFAYLMHFRKPKHLS